MEEFADCRIAGHEELPPILNVADEPASSGSREVRLARGRPLTVVGELCARCVASGRTCASCVQRRRYAWSLVTQQGRTVDEVARTMNLAPCRVQELVATERDKRELNSLRCDSIPIQRTQSVIADALARDPDLTIGEIAKWLDMSKPDFERAFLGRPHGGRAKQRVTVASASRLMLALGLAPNELEGC
jgi:hypothetical protein